MPPKSALLDPQTGRPLYLQVVDQLRAELASQAAGERIASEPQLSKRFGVSRFTVASAIEILVDEGLLNRRQGLGTFVAAAPLRRAASYLQSFTESVASAGRESSHRLLSFGPAPARDGEERLIGMKRLRLVDDNPTAIHHSRIAASIAERIGLTAEVATQPRFSLYRLFDDAGLSVARGVESLRARAASADETQLLRLSQMSDRVVMSVHRESFASDGTVLDVVDAVYDARRYSYEAEIRRDRGSVSATSRSPTQQETSDASRTHGRHAFGPRLGPWGGANGDGG